MTRFRIFYEHFALTQKNNNMTIAPLSMKNLKIIILLCVFWGISHCIAAQEISQMTRLISLSHLKVDDVYDVLNKMRSQDGKVVAVEQTNSFVLVDTAQKIESMV